MAGGWADLPEDILRMVFSRLPKAIDRAMATFTCPQWHGFSMRIGHPLPLLLTAEGNGLSYHRVALGARTLLFTDVVSLQGTRILGARGRSLAVEIPEHARRRNGRYVVLGLEGQITTALPEQLRVPLDIRSFPVVVHTVVGGPDFFAALVTCSEATFAFWGVGVGDTPYWTPPISTNFAMIGQWRRMLPSSPVEDIVEVPSGFVVLTVTEEISMYQPVVSPFNTLTMTRTRIIKPNRRIPQPIGQSVARYLCSFRGGDNFFLVRRFLVPGQGTMSFEVFGGVERVNDEGRVTTAWSKVRDLRGVTIFIGRGCSGVIHTGRARRSYIFFIDDAGYRETPTGGPYPCSDTGRYHYAPDADVPTVVQLDSPPHPTSTSSPPIWIWFY